MRHCLPSRQTQIHPDIEAIRAVTLLYRRTSGSDRASNGRLLLWGRVKPALDVPAGNQERVARGDWEPVPYSQDEWGFMKDPGGKGRAKGTPGRRHGRNLPRGLDGQ